MIVDKKSNYTKYPHNDSFFLFMPVNLPAADLMMQNSSLCFMLLSIIIPTYNNPKNLSRCLENIERQTVFNNGKCQAEEIVVDDGSSRNYADDYAELRGKININFFRIDHSGAAAARNFGFSKSSGNYVFFCDSDVKFLKPDALEKMIAVLEKNSDKAYCYSSFKYGWKTFKLFSFNTEKLKQNNYVSTMSMVRRSAFMKIIDEKNQPFDESLKRFQDWDLWLTLLEHNETGVWLPEILWQAQVGGSMSKWLPKIFYKLPFLKKVKDYEQTKKIVQIKHKLLLNDK